MLMSVLCCEADNVDEASGLGDDIHVGAAGEAELGGANGLLELEMSMSSYIIGETANIGYSPIGRGLRRGTRHWCVRLWLKR